MSKAKAIQTLLPYYPNENVDPIRLVSVGDWVILQNIHSTLVELAARNTVGPALAESWSQSHDAKLWNFKLRSGLKWSDGSPLTPEHVYLSIKRALNSTSHTDLATYVKEVVFDNKKQTITFTLNRLSPNFLVSLALADMSIVHPESYKNKKYTWVAPLSGPYMVTKFSKQVILLTRNKFYWNNKNQDFDQVIFERGFRSAGEIERFYKEKYDAGQVFTGLVNDINDFGILKKDYDIFSSNLDMNLVFCFSKTKRNINSLTEEQRKYLFKNIYQHFWKEDMSNPGRSIGLRPPGMFGALSVKEFDDAYNRLVVTKKVRFTRPLLIAASKDISQLPYFLKTTKILENLNIKYKIIFVEPGNLASVTSTGNYDLLAMMLGASEYDPDTAWRIFNDVNFAKPPATAKQLDAALFEKDPKKREEMYKDFERKAIREALLIPLKNEPTYIITSKKLKLDTKLATDWGLQIYKLRRR